VAAYLCGGSLEGMQAQLAGPELAKSHSEHHVQAMLAAQELIRLALTYD
jgi:hypothetical protein